MRSFCKFVIIPNATKSEVTTDRSCLCFIRSILMSKLGFLYMKVLFLTNYVCPTKRCVNVLPVLVLSSKLNLELLLKHFAKFNPFL